MRVALDTIRTESRTNCKRLNSVCYLEIEYFPKNLELRLIRIFENISKVVK